MSQRAHNNYQYDVFLSHNSCDKKAVEYLAGRLRGAGLRPFFDEWDLVPGTPWQEALEEAIEGSASCAVFLGPNGLGPWENEEMRAALDRRVRDSDFRVIPVLLPQGVGNAPLHMPLFLSRLTYVDFRGGLYDSASLRRLLAGIRGQLEDGEFATNTWLLINFERGNSEERKRAALRLGKLKSAGSVAVFRNRWGKEPDATVRHCIALALGEIGDSEAVETLRRLRDVETDSFARLGIDLALEDEWEEGKDEDE